MSREISEIDKLKAENALLRESMLWLAKNSLDSAARSRAKDTLRQIDPRLVLDVERNDADIYGEWCI